MATVGDRQTDTHTDAGDFIICPMLCYSNGTDNDITCRCVCVSNHGAKQVKVGIMVCKRCSMPSSNIVDFSAGDRISISTGNCWCTTFRSKAIQGTESARVKYS